MGRLRARAGLAVLGVLVMSCVTSQPLKPGDEDLVATVTSLVPFGVEVPPGYREHETFQRDHVTGGTILFEYTFERPDKRPPFVYSLAELHRTPGDACRSFSAGNVGMWLAGLDLTERNDLFQYGKKSRFALVEKEGSPVGNFFSMCHSRTAFLVMIVGVYFDDGDSWQAFVAPRLEALAAFEAGNP